MTAAEEKAMAMVSPQVRTLTKQVLELAWGKDPIDALWDVELALSILKKRVDELLTK